MKKWTKTLLCLVMSAAMVVSLAACGNNEDQPGGTDGQNSQTVEPTTPDPTTPDPAVDEDEAWKKEPAYGQTLHYWISDGCTSAPAVAEALGYYEEAGLTVEGFKGTSDVEGLGTGAVQVAVGHIAKQLVPATNGVDLCFVGGAHTGCKSLYVLGSSDYQTTEDLKGTKIAVPNGIGNSDYNITARLLDADGINPLEDVDLVQVENSACVPAMQNGELGAALLSDTFAYHMVEDGTLRPIRSMLDEDLNQICCVIGMQKSFVEKNPITAEKLASCVKRALKYMSENPEEATKLLMELELEGDDFDMNLAYNISLQFGQQDNDYTESQLRLIISDYIRLGLLTASDDVDKLLDQVWHPIGSAE